MTRASDPAVMGLAEVAEFLDVRRPNVRKMLKRAGIEPLAELANGPVWDRATIKRFKSEREQDPRRETDERRRATARAKAQGS